MAWDIIPRDNIPQDIIPQDNMPQDNLAWDIIPRDNIPQDNSFKMFQMKTISDWIWLKLELSWSLSIMVYCFVNTTQGTILNNIFTAPSKSVICDWDRGIRNKDHLHLWLFFCVVDPTKTQSRIRKWVWGEKWWLPWLLMAQNFAWLLNSKFSWSVSHRIRYPKG